MLVTLHLHATCLPVLRPAPLCLASAERDIRVLLPQEQGGNNATQQEPSASELQPRSESRLLEAARPM